MKSKNKIKLLVCAIILLIISALILSQSTKKVTYIEYEKYGKNCNETLDMCSNEYSIEQEFQIPYRIFHGISLHIGNYGRENNSRYELIIKDKTMDKQIAFIEFNTSQATDENAYELFLNSPIKIDNTHTFSAIIKAKTPVNAENGVAFYVDNGAENKGNLYYNNSTKDGTLCMNVYGGNLDAFWFLFTLGSEIYVAILILYVLNLYFNQKSIRSNYIVQTGILGIVVFSLLAVFARIDTFSDEADNIIGGMLIHKDYTLYTDYYSGHTPVAYWICSIFSILGAKSVEQFRLLYDVFIMLIYIGLFLRHKEHFGKFKMFILPIIQITFGILISKETIMILSDNIQTICMIALCLEFLRYLKDEKLDWDRAIIVSLCIFGSFGSAFVSAYAIFVIGIGVLIKEISYWKNNKLSFPNFIKRYWKLVFACAVPFTIAFVYLVVTHSFWMAYEQAFQFNTQVYSVYLEGGFGSNALQPFLIGIVNFIQIIPQAISSIIQNTQIEASILKIIIAILFIIKLLKLIHQKEYLKTIIIFLLISFSFTRSNETFHEITAWSLMIAAILVLLDKKDIQKNSYRICIMVSILLILSIYADFSMQAIFQKPRRISELEKQIIDETTEGEGIFYDIYSYPSVYLIYKERLPINRLTFVLPWYMDWYELDTIDDLITKHPNIVLYDEDLKAWEISGYDDYLQKYLHENYEQITQNKKIWKLKQS